jgi:hypothetical protein
VGSYIIGAIWLFVLILAYRGAIRRKYLWSLGRALPFQEGEGRQTAIWNTIDSRNRYLVAI